MFFARHVFVIFFKGKKEEADSWSDDDQTSSETIRFNVYISHRRQHETLNLIILLDVYMYAS